VGRPGSGSVGTLSLLVAIAQMAHVASAEPTELNINAAANDLPSLLDISSKLFPIAFILPERLRPAQETYALFRQAECASVLNLTGSVEHPV
jgi:hypothetical protein